jgi:DNA-binding NtrC family response regulator
MKSKPMVLYQGDPPHSRLTPASRAKAKTPAKTLLLVDDDLSVREMETEVLRRQGYTVLETESAAEALRLAASNPMIDLLITDLLMPEADGLDLTRRFCALHPGTPVLVISGSLPLLHVRDKLDLSRFEFLPKPFHLDELLNKVHTLLGMSFLSECENRPAANCLQSKAVA